jgi:hypothetical protein
MNSSLAYSSYGSAPRKFQSTKSVRSRHREPADRANQPKDRIGAAAPGWPPGHHRFRSNRRHRGLKSVPARQGRLLSVPECPRSDHPACEKRIEHGEPNIPGLPVEPLQLDAQGRRPSESGQDRGSAANWESVPNDDLSTCGKIRTQHSPSRSLHRPEQAPMAEW